MNQLVWTIRAILLTASVLLGLGLVAPCMTIHPSLGESIDGWLRLFKPDELEPTTYSVIGGILELIRGGSGSGSAALGVLLLAFSVVFPAVKLAALWWGVSVLQAGRPAGAALWLTHHAGKFSMLDVMVVALLVVAIKGLPGGTQITVGWGLYAFAASVLLGMFASLQAKQLEHGYLESA